MQSKEKTLALWERAKTLSERSEFSVLGRGPQA